MSLVKSYKLLVLAGIMCLFTSAAARNSLSIHLNLAKTILALAEPTMLTVTISNNSNDSILIDNQFLFGAAESPYPLRLYMITPDGEKWLYRGGRCLHVTYFPDSPIYLWLPPKDHISEEEYLWCTFFAPKKYQQALEKVPPGHYFLYASYDSPHQKDLSDEVIYSDTVEFVYIPLKTKDTQSINALHELDSLKDSFLCGFLSSDRVRFERIRDSHTAYSEAANASLLSVILFSLEEDSYQKFMTEKRRFDESYPQSPYQRHLLKLQSSYFNNRRMKTELESNNEILLQRFPDDRKVLSTHNMLETASPNEIEERRVQ